MTFRKRGGPCEGICPLPLATNAMLQPVMESRNLVSRRVSRLGLGLETCLKNRFFQVLVSTVSGLVSISKDFGLETLHELFFYEVLQEAAP